MALQVVTSLSQSIRPLALAFNRSSLWYLQLDQHASTAPVRCTEFSLTKGRMQRWQR